MQTTFIYAKNGEAKTVSAPFTIAQYNATKKQKAKLVEANNLQLAATTIAILNGNHAISILNANHFEHITLKNSDKSPLRARRNGKTKVWKTKPGKFQIPVKYGLKTCFYITDKTAYEWNVAG
jgi:hypothetical protein